MQNLQKMPPSAQARAALVICALFLLTAFLLHAIVHSEYWEHLLMRTDEAIARKNRHILTYKAYYIDSEDRVINREIPNADYSKGGVYLFGTSNLKWATRLWDLPSDQRSLIHNYGMGSCNHGFQFQMLQYLTEHAGLLAAGGDKNLVIIGCSYHCVGTACDITGYFPSLWKRHGLFSYSLAGGIVPQERNAIWRAVHFERVRMGECLLETLSTLAHCVGWHNALPRHNAATYNRERAEWMGTDWKEKMQTQLHELSAMLDYLAARKVRSVVAFLPQGTWEDKLPYESTYKEMVADLCRSKDIPVKDWSKLLPDDDFADSNHPNIYGIDKLQRKFLELALPFLRSTGALPSAAGQ